MFGGLGWPEVGVLLVLGLFLFGPERLPGMAADAGRTLRKIRRYLHEMSEDLKSELGPEMAGLDLTSLHPREFVRRNLLEGDDEPFPVARSNALGPGEAAPWDPDTT